MIEEETLLELKLKYGPLFSADIKGSTVLFREIKFSEFDRIIKLQQIEDSSSIDIEDEVIKVAVVYPTNFNVDRLPAGLVSRTS